MFGHMDISYTLLVGFCLLIGWAAQAYIKHSYAEWSRVPIPSGQTGLQAAQAMLQSADLDLPIVRIDGHLSDNYNPANKTLSLSGDNFSGSSVASLAVACHEVGHAIQHARLNPMLMLRNGLAPILQIVSNWWYYLLIAGIILRMTGLITTAIILFALVVAFQVITLPVEIDASRRAIKYIKSAGYSDTVVQGARSVLTAAALTYVAAALSSILNLLYMISRFSSRR